MRHRQAYAGRGSNVEIPPIGILFYVSGLVAELFFCYKILYVSCVGWGGGGGGGGWGRLAEGSGIGPYNNLNFIWLSFNHTNINQNMFF